MRILYVDGKSLELEIKLLAKYLGVSSVPFDYARFFGNLGSARTYYYDALPDKKIVESDEEYQIRLDEKKQLFGSLNRISNTHVRTGTSRWSKRTGTKQKAVDVLLAVDAVSHTLKGVTDQVVLLVSDLDFYPVLEVITHTRARAELIYRPHVTSNELIEAADVSRRLTKTFLLQSCHEGFFQKYLAFESGTDYTPIPANEREEWSFARFQNSEVCIRQREDGNYFVKWNGHYSVAEYLDLALESMFAFTHEELKFSKGEQYPARVEL